MNPPRCWEGALCRIVRSEAGNENKRVVVQRPAEYGDCFGVPMAMLSGRIAAGSLVQDMERGRLRGRP